MRGWAGAGYVVLKPEHAAVFATPSAFVFRSDEAARKLDAELAAARQRVVQLEGMLQLRERELERAKR